MQRAGKIRLLPSAEAEIRAQQAQGKTVVHCHGVFDLLHIGHLKHLQSARKAGDYLVVTVTPDRFVNKGPGRPEFHETLRAEALEAVECVDLVCINEWKTAVEVIGYLRPDVFVKGSEYRDASQDVTGGISIEQKAIEAAGGRLLFTDDVTFSSSNLLNKHFTAQPKELRDQLAAFKTRHTAQPLVELIQSLRGLRVLLLGETIIDVYERCETMGKAGKEPILAARHLGTESYPGGALAAANHLAEFCDSVDLVSFIGAVDSYEPFIRQTLNPRIKTTLIPLEGEPTIVKRRFVEHYPFQKLFEVYTISGKETHLEGTRQLLAHLDPLLAGYDLVLALDYGHGLLTPSVVKLLCEKASKLAVNTQVNAHNRGFNTISKYLRADYVCLSEAELRLDRRDREGDLKELVRAVAEQLQAARLTATRGSQGCLCFDQDSGFVNMPAFSNRIVDRVGAGDAVFAVTSLCAAMGAPAEVVAFIANAVGAQAVEIVANQRPVSSLPLIRHIQTLLK
jgi:rfaE bifunctional protein nucleotidyltransferase chain/domain